MWRLMSGVVAVAAATLITATATEAAPINAARIQVSDGLVGDQDSLVTQVRFTPPGFSHGRKVGWHGRHHPPGWSHGRKVGWHHPSMPLGLRR